MEPFSTLLISPENFAKIEQNNCRETAICFYNYNLHSKIIFGAVLA